MQFAKRKIVKVNINREKNTCGLLIQNPSGTEVWVNQFLNPAMENLSDGDTVYLWLYEEEYNGKMYLKFRLPSVQSLFAMAHPNLGIDEIAADMGGKPEPIKVEDIPL